jgi:hypothetical protein
MDHHHVADPVNPLIEVPYICLKEYDNRGFFDYPIRQDRHGPWLLSPILARYPAALLEKNLA